MATPDLQKHLRAEDYRPLKHPWKATNMGQNISEFEEADFGIKGKVQSSEGSIKT